MSQSLRQPRASVYSLGCKVNRAEARAAAEDLLHLGYRLVPFGRPADVCLVNTCSVTDHADAKSRAVIRRAGRQCDDPLIVATGCYADVAPAEVSALPNVAAVVPNAEKPRLAEIAHDALLRSGRLLYPLCLDEDADVPEDPDLIPLLGDARLARTRAVIKVQDGCNHFCSFCIIPYARGRLRSRPVEEVMAEARQHVEAGCREVVLAGICLGDFGDERGFPREGGDPLARLLPRLAAIPGLSRIRLSSLDPADVSHELVDTIGSTPEVCRHLHLSLQAGDDEVLRRMRRRYSAQEFAALVDRIYAAGPGCALTCDVIAGFPGETAEQFDATVGLCEAARFIKIHVFPYSPRSGTLAARWPDAVPPREKERRCRVLSELSERQGLAFAQQHLGEELEVLVESRSRRTGFWSGLTGHYLRVEFESEAELHGELVRVRAESAGPDGVFGELVQAE
jgi:threonylcarbamoyladenosine tRNA methylthiotransferase MtaB